MGIVWEAYHKGVPLLGVPENPIDTLKTMSCKHLHDSEVLVDSHLATLASASPNG